MPTLGKSSGATILRPPGTELIRIVEYTNPEIVIPRMLQKYLQEIGFSSIYPNFKNVRISAVHPFALLLFQSWHGTKLDLSVFPSITITDSSDSETAPELTMRKTDYVLTDDMVYSILSQVDAGRLIISDENRTRLEAAVADGTTKITAVKYSNRYQHSVDMNIWSDNKDLTSLIYDFCKKFIEGNVVALHNEGLDVINPIAGRRSGDINVEFGHLLYGANLTVALTIETGSMIIDLAQGTIETINLDPNYSVEEGVR